jgi:hypothetical protein
MSSIRCIQGRKSDSYVLFQIFDIAQCYPPQPEEGECPRREFTEALEDLASVAPSSSRASTKKKRAASVDVVEDSEDAADASLSSGDNDDAAIFAKLLDSRPPPRTEKRTLRNFGLNAS